MTSPIGGDSLGTAQGKVRITYESAGVSKAVKDLEGLQNSLNNAGESTSDLGTRATSVHGSLGDLSSQLRQVREQVDQYARAVENANKRVEAMERRGVKGNQLVNAKGLAARTQEDLDRTKALLKQWEQYARNQGPKLPTPRADRSSIRAAVDEFRRVVATEMMRGAAQGQLSGRTSLSTLIAPGRTLHEIGTVGIGAGREFGIGISKGLKLAGPALAMAAKAAVAGVGAAVAAAGTALGYTLTKGFQRLEGLDRAAMKLNALGHSTAEIESISKSALESVRDTAYGLDEAFNVAASAIASGIKPGEELTQYLKTVADNAALANLSMEEMGYIFGKVMTQGKVMGGELDLFTERNIDIIGNLSKELGVARSRVAEMASSSQISSEVFLKAMQRNAGAAVTMGQTISGSFRNLKASISRIGAGFLAPLFGEANGETSQFAKAIQWVTDQLKKFEEWLAHNKTTIVDIWANGAKAVVTFGKVALEVLATITDVVTGLGGLIGDVAGQIVNAYTEFNRLLGKDVSGLDATANALFGIGDQTKDWGKQLRGLIPQLDKAYPLIDKWAVSTKQQLSAQKESVEASGEATTAYQSLSDQLEELGVKTDTVTKAIEGSVQEFDKLLETLRDNGASQQLIDQITRLRERFDSGGRAAKGYAEAIRNMKDQTIDASSKADALIRSLKNLGLLPGGDELDAYEDAFRDLAKYNADLVDQLDTTGSALINLDGTFNTNYENANRLKEAFDAVRDSAFRLAASGEVAPGEVYDETVRRLAYLLEQFGITGEEAQRFIEQNLTGGKAQFEAQFVGDPVAALQATIQDPVQLQTMLNLLTTHQDIVREVTGGTGKVQIPAELIGPDGQPLGNVPATSNPVQPNMPAIPGYGMHWEDGKGWVPDAGTTAPEPPKPLSQTVSEAIQRYEERQKQDRPEDQPWYKGVLDDLMGKNLGQGSLTYFWPGNDKSVSQVPLDQRELDALKDTQITREIMAQDYELMYYLQQRQDEYEAQGKTLAEAYADGILSGDEEIRNAIKKLAQIAADGLGHSPALYGPLSGRGWTFYRGQDFTRAWAQGIESEAETAKSAVGATAMAATVPFGDQVERMIGDLQELSDFGKMLLDFGMAIGEIAFSSLRIANDLSGGRLFPKTYVPDENFDPRRGSALPPWNPTRLPVPGSPAAAGQPGFAVSTTAAKPGQGLVGDTVTYTVDYLQKAGWAPLFGPDGQLPAIVNQALAPFGIRAQTPDFHGSLHGKRGGVGYAIDIAGDLKQQEKLAQLIMDTPELRSQVAQLIFQGPSGRRYGIAGGADVSNTAYYAGQWEAHMDHVHLAAQQSVFAAIAQGLGLPASAITSGQLPAAFSGPTGGAFAPAAQAVAQAVTGKQMEALGNGFYKERGGNAVFRQINGKYYNVQDIALSGGGQPKLNEQGVPLLNRPATAGMPQGGGTTPQSQISIPTLAANASQQEIANYIYSKALAEGYTDKQARDFVIQAYGESHLSPTAYNPAGWSGIFQFDKSTWEMAGGGNVMDAKQNIDNYFRLARMRDLTPESFTSGTQLGTQVSIGGPWHPENAAKGHLNSAMRGAAPFLTNLSPSTGLPVDVRAMPDNVVQPLQGVFDNTRALPQIPSGLEQYRDLLGNMPRSQDEAVSWLQRIDGAIADQNLLNTPQAKLAAEQLGQVRSQTMSQFGLTEGPSQLEQAQQIFQGVGGIASSAFAVFDAGLQYISAWKTVSETLVRGIANTQDIMTLIDQFQVGLDFFTKAADLGSQITSFVGSFTSSQDYGITSAVGGIVGMVSQVMNAINMWIDIGQEAYSIITKYVGRFITSIAGFPGATDMRYLLDEYTGQVLAYTSENPLNKHAFNTLPRALGKRYPDERPAPVNNLYIYQGPGQDPRDTMDDAMFTIRQSGVGAFGYASSGSQGW